jgi:hypothetical protein
MTKNTPFAKWRDDGETDPHGEHYSKGVESLAHGNYPSEFIAHALTVNVSDIFFITWLTAGKERLRWLSRKLYNQAHNHKEINEHRACLLLGHLTDDELANEFYLSESIEDLKAGRERILWLNERINSLSSSQ